MASAKEPRTLEMRLQGLGLPWVFDRFETRHAVIRSNSGSTADLTRGLSAMVTRILETYPPGLVRFLFIDPVGLGEKFALFHELADQDEKLISSRIWSTTEHIVGRLDELVEHIENVIHTYLRADFPTIEDYNKEAGETAEAYRFVVVHDFPEGFDERACQALQRIVANGARCGVHVILVWNTKRDLPHGIKEEQLFASAQAYSYRTAGELQMPLPGTDVALGLRFEYVDESDTQRIVVAHGASARAGSHVETPYGRTMDRLFRETHSPLGVVDARWTGRSAEVLAGPLGVAGARRLQMFQLGVGTAHHALMVGRTGSGKTNLLHVLITALAEIYSPSELEVYLVDFKEGVEFKDYADERLPHARVVALETDPEFGLSVLRGIDAEMKRRADTFKSARTRAQNLRDYREQGGEAMPRILIVVDEFHELFSGEHAVTDEALGIVDRIARQGRSTGVHLLLSSQSLSGVGLPDGIFQQFGVRIAMQCSAEDSRRVFTDDNSAARGLDRPGAAIYNDQSGLIEGNNPFQTSLLNRKDRVVRLGELRERALADRPGQFTDGPFVFEGSAPASFGGCRPFQRDVAAWPPATAPRSLALRVGEPIAMEEAHAIHLKTQGGANLLVLGREEKLTYGVLFSSLLSLAAQTSPEQIAFQLVDLSTPDGEWSNGSQVFAAHFPHTSTVHGRRQIEKVISDAAEEIECRQQLDSAGVTKKIVLAFFSLNRARQLRQDDGGLGGFGDLSGEKSVHDKLSDILRDGPDVGVHTIFSCDTRQNLMRLLGRRDLEEIGHRMSSALSQADSEDLFYSAVASKLRRENRMVCYDDEKPGAFVAVRPYEPWPEHEVVRVGNELATRWRKHDRTTKRR